MFAVNKIVLHMLGVKHHFPRLLPNSLCFSGNLLYLDLLTPMLTTGKLLFGLSRDELEPRGGLTADLHESRRRRLRVTQLYTVISRMIAFAWHLGCFEIRQ